MTILVPDTSNTILFIHPHMPGSSVPFQFLLMLLSLILFCIHYMRIRPARRSDIIRLFLLWQLVIPVGIGSIWAGLAHIFMGPEIAVSIGWPPDNPFQTEVGIANLSFGILGLLCLKFKDSFWLATILGYGIFLFGAGLGHINQIITRDNLAVNNTGAVLYTDLLYPVILVALYGSIQFIRKRELTPPELSR